MDSTKLHLNDLQKFIETQIPIARNMGFQLTSINYDRAELTCPLFPNRNHKGTAFGGSLYAVCTIASYALFFHGLQTAGFNTNDIVISKGEIKYSRPVDDDFTVEAIWSPEERSTFFESLKAKGKARIEIQAMIRAQNEICAVFFGHFAARLSTRN